VSLKEASKAAHKLGMKLMQCPEDGTLCSVRCIECGWPKPPKGKPFDWVLAVYAADPTGCAACAWRAGQVKLKEEMRRRRK
jgi:hypothetical protein